MFDIDKFIKLYVTHRDGSIFSDDIESNRCQITAEVSGKSLLVIGGAGSIGSSFIKAILPYNPSRLYVIDVSENELTELTRDLRSTEGMYVPKDYKTYPIGYANPIFEKIFRAQKGFDIVANFSAHKHVRSEKDQYSVEALIENNVINASKLLNLLVEFPPKHFFCVSTDKAANPVNVMGASKRIMEDMIMAYSDKFNVCTARFANVAFSNGSLLDGIVKRFAKKQPIAAPNDVKRFFVSPQESGQICMLACILGKNRDIFFPKLKEEQMMTFSNICDLYLNARGYSARYCESEDDAKRYAAGMPEDSKSYPVYYSSSDTNGEKAYEEFYTSREKLDMERFKSLGVIEGKKAKSLADIKRLFNNLNNLFARPSFTKEEVVKVMEDYLPNFQHIETGKNLDQKM